MDLKLRFGRNVGEWLFAGGFIITGLVFLVVKGFGLSEISPAFKVLFGMGYLGGALMILGCVIVLAKYMKQ